MLESDLLSEIKSKLGYPVVKLEIDPQHEDVILKSTYRWFNSRKGMIVERPFHLQSLVCEYTLDRGVLGVIDYIPQLDVTYQYPSIVNDVLDVDYIPAYYARAYSEFVQYMQMIERRKEIFSAVTSYEFVGNSGSPRPPFVRIYPMPDKDRLGVLILRIKATRESLQFASPIDEEFFVRYGVTVLKEILIHTRGKYAELPAAQNTVNMDADRLKDEFDAERAQLELDIRDWQEPMGIFTDRGI